MLLASTVKTILLTNTTCPHLHVRLKTSRSYRTEIRMVGTRGREGLGRKEWLLAQGCDWMGGLGAPLLQCENDQG